MTEISGTALAPVSSWRPERSWWLLLLPVIAAGFLGNWLIAAGVVVVLLIHHARPYDPVTAFILVVGGATFVNYQHAAGSLTKQMGALSVGIVWMLACYALRKRQESVSIPRTEMTLAFCAFLLWSMINAFRGLFSGYSLKALGLELFPILALVTSFLLANVLDPKRDLKGILVAMLVIVYGSAAWGFQTFREVGTHVTGVYFGPAPGFAALLLFNLALRAESLSRSYLWLALALPLFLHQFLSFGRGMWLGNMVGVTSSLLIFAIGRGSQGAWRRAGVIMGSLLLTGVVGAVGLAVFYGQADILIEAGTRFATIGDTSVKRETMATIARLVEYATVIGEILQQPWIGHGLGYEFFVKSPIPGAAKALQYWVHENYLLVWLKQGIMGLGLFLWMLWSAFWMGARQSRLQNDPWLASWLAGSAATTAYMTMFALTDFPFDWMHPVFHLALFWGVAMALARSGSWHIRWASPTPRSDEGGAFLPPATSP